MANEAIPYIQPTRFGRVTVADANALAQYTIMKLTTPNTGAACSADNDVPAGILMSSKAANDGQTEMTVALDGEWGLLTSAAAITIGNQVTINGANEIKIYTTLDDEKGYCLGKALETIGAAATVIRVRLNL
jgi:hypothetical protein